MAKGRVPGPLGSITASQSGARGAQLVERFADAGPLRIGAETAGRASAALALTAHEIDYDLLYEDLVAWEGKVPWMYLDSKGLVTVGVGFYLKDVAQAQALPFINTSTDATASKDEIKTAYEAVAKMEAKLGAKKYKLDPSIELAEDRFREIAIQKLKKTYVPAMRKYFAGFDTYPTSAQRALIDLAYNGGAFGTSQLRLAADVLERRWRDAAANVPVRGQQRRTDFRIQLFEAAALEDGQ